MKLKNALIILLIVVIILIVWTLPNNTAVCQSSAVSELTKTNEMIFLGEKFLTLDKYVTHYNKKGKVVDETSYLADSCFEKYSFTYTNYDSLSKKTHFIGQKQTPVNFEIFDYDDLNRPIHHYEYTIRYKSLTADTILYVKTTFCYNSLNKLIKKISERFTERFLAPAYTKSSMISDGGYVSSYKYNEQGELISDTSVVIFGKDLGKNDTTIANYQYDKNGYLKSEFNRDSIYYKNDSHGKVLEKTLKNKDYSRLEEKNWYDKKENLIQTFLGIDDGITYEYQYDNCHHLVLKKNSGSYFLIFSTCLVFKYKYF